MALHADITRTLEKHAMAANVGGPDRPVRGSPGLFRVNLPNLVTMARLLIVPLVVWAIASREWQLAFALFLAAGISDAVDGFLAKRLNQTSVLGAYLDPLADKALIVSIYVSLAIMEVAPRSLVILVVSRDILIVGGVLLAWVLGKPMTVRPHPVSKVNTAAQIGYACVVLGSLAFGLNVGFVELGLEWAVALLTLASIGFYVWEWLRHMTNGIVAP
jgi:cardiolipin synthase